MFSRKELIKAIDDLENAPNTFQNAEKLATFYCLYDHLFCIQEPVQRVEQTKEVTIDRYGESEFFSIIDGKTAGKAWNVIDELMQTIQVLHPKLYQATIDRLKE